jgi:hypothetical protein
MQVALGHLGEEIAADDLRAVGQPGPGEDGGRIAERLGPIEHHPPRVGCGPGIVDRPRDAPAGDERGPYSGRLSGSPPAKSTSADAFAPPGWHYGM